MTGPHGNTRAWLPFRSQDAMGALVLGLLVAGPGCGLSEESMSGCESAALETESFPGVPTRARHN